MLMYIVLCCMQNAEMKHGVQMICQIVPLEMFSAEVMCQLVVSALPLVTAKCSSKTGPQGTGR